MLNLPAWAICRRKAFRNSFDRSVSRCDLSQSNYTHLAPTSSLSPLIFNTYKAAIIFAAYLELYRVVFDQIVL